VAGWIMAFNPVSPVLTTARDWISGVPPSHVHGFLTVSLLVMVGLVASWLVYRLVLPRVVERLGM
jgi:lipopolysaccharide transport system permease protein